jgi:hypothetical protein
MASRGMSHLASLLKAASCCGPQKDAKIFFFLDDGRKLTGGVFNREAVAYRQTGSLRYGTSTNDTLLTTRVEPKGSMRFYLLLYSQYYKQA